MAKKAAKKAERAAFVRHGKLRRSNSWRNALRALLTTVIVVALSGVATVAYAALNLWQNVDTVKLGNANTVGAGSRSLDGEINILLVGSDTREGQSFNDGEEGELNDVNLLLNISADHKNATVVSFPRDLMLPIPSCPGPNGEPGYYSAMSEQQLNTAMSYGGLPCVVETISELTGMDIPYAGKVTFDGVIGVSNAIGGVDVCLTQPIQDDATGLDLQAGVNTLQGWDALQFLRTRYGVGDGGDTSRISNQQVFMSALVRKLKDSKTLSDPIKVFALAKAGVENMQLSESMTGAPFMQALAGTVKDIDLDRINFVQYPTFAHPYEAGRLTPDSVSAQALFNVLKSGQPFAVTGVGEGVTVDGKTNTDQKPQAQDPSAGDQSTGDQSQTQQPSDGTTTTPDGTVQLPPQITGTRPSTESCSAGRTVL